MQHQYNPVGAETQILQTPPQDPQPEQRGSFTLYHTYSLDQLKDIPKSEFSQPVISLYFSLNPHKAMDGNSNGPKVYQTYLNSLFTEAKKTANLF